MDKFGGATNINELGFPGCVFGFPSRPTKRGHPQQKRRLGHVCTWLGESGSASAPTELGFPFSSLAAKANPVVGPDVTSALTPQ